jgi:two-component system, chemotaxis family, protein-glutamate methylesterase/glutaminase
VRLARLPALPPSDIGSEIARLEGTTLGRLANVVCPLCDGVLTEAEAGRYAQFRCHVGHVFSLESLLHEQRDQLERALWGAVRALEESAALSDKIASRESGDLKQRFSEKARTQRDEADAIRHILLRGTGMKDDAAGLS